MIQSAGILVYKKQDNQIKVLLVHPGGPFWAKKDVWQIPKGELEEEEDLQTGAEREFLEEIGVPVPSGKRLDLGEAKKGSKVNHIWAVEGDIDLSHFAEQRVKNTVRMEWPLKSGKQIEFAENDRVEWTELSVALGKVFKNQTIFIERLAADLKINLNDAPSEPSSYVQQSLL